MPPFSSLLKILEHPAAQTGNATECAPRTPVTLFGTWGKIGGRVSASGIESVHSRAG